IPNHINYKRVIGTFYNQYHPLPVSIFEDENMNLSQLEGLIPNSINFIKHLFGDQWEFGLDYIKNLLERPTQPLPILCLVSKERSTGKSTFLKWMKILFGLNMTYVKGGSFTSQFNSDWAGKLIIALEEVLFQDQEQTEQLKFLSTTN